MLICPYTAQVKHVIKRFKVEGVQYHRCLTVDSAQGSESNVVIFRLTKPQTNPVAEVRFLSEYRRLNVASTRAKQLMVVVGILTIWKADFVKKASGGSSRYLAGFLKDAINESKPTERG
jgi:superfamily I DNA and/or RNA helicase